MQSCGGQVIPPAGYFQKVAEYVQHSKETNNSGLDHRGKFKSVDEAQEKYKATGLLY